MSRVYFYFTLGIFINIILLSTVAFGQASENLDELIKKGDYHAKLEQYEEALPYFEKVLEIDPTNLHALKAKGIILVFTREFEEASLILDKALELDPNDLDTINLKAIVLASLGKSQEAGSFLLRASEINLDIQSLVLKGQEHYDESEYEEALSYFDDALELDPDYLEALNGKAVTLYDLGKFEEALHNLQKAINLSPNDPVLIQNRHEMILNLPRDSYPEGSLKLQIRDSDGRLVGYQEVIGFGIFLHNSTEQFLDRWELKKGITQEGQDYEVLQIRQSVQVDLERPFSLSLVSTLVNGTEMPNILALNHGMPTQKGDVISELWTRDKPVG